MTEDNSKQEGQEVSVWPGRYIVEGSIGEMSHGGHIYKDVWIRLFRHEMPVGEVRSLLKSIGYTDSVIRGYEQDIISQVEDTFTEEQADQLIAYLKKYPDIKAWKKKAEELREAMKDHCSPVEGETGTPSCLMMKKMAHLRHGLTMIPGEQNT